MAQQGLAARLLERVLSEVPSVLDRLSDEDKVNLAATRRGVLEAVLRGCRAVLVVTNDDYMLHALGVRMREGPCVGELLFCGIRVPATCAAPLWSAIGFADRPGPGDSQDERFCKWLNVVWRLTKEKTFWGESRVTGLAVPAFYDGGVAQVPQALSLQHILRSTPVANHLRFLRMDLSQFRAGEAHDAHVGALQDAVRGLQALERLDLACIDDEHGAWTSLFRDLGSLTRLRLSNMTIKRNNSFIYEVFGPGDVFGRLPFVNWLESAANLRRLELSNVNFERGTLPPGGFAPPRRLEVVHVCRSNHPFCWRDAVNVRRLRIDSAAPPSEDEWAEIGAMMRRSKALRELDMRYAAVTSGHFTEVFDALPHSTVEKFRCQWQALSQDNEVDSAADDDEADAHEEDCAAVIECVSAGLVAALKRPSSPLQHVGIFGHFMESGDPSSTSEFRVSDVATALEGNTTLRKLGLSGCGIHDGHAAAIGHMLERSQSLVHLRLGRSLLSWEGVREIAAGLQRNTTMRTLRLNANLGLGADGIKELTDALVAEESACQLQHLDLTLCNAEDEGAKHVAAYLQHPRCTLRTLNLHFNDITDAGAAAIASALESNATLESLMLCENHISIGGGRRLADALERNDTLRAINFAMSLPQPWDVPEHRDLMFDLRHARKYANERRGLD
ncbi:unnamed protein product [Pedinophyceae sp. YPF-701]|nr:unnamed protein product [Pedinophyceae sp. YPF-701]